LRSSHGNRLSEAVGAIAEPGQHLAPDSFRFRKQPQPDVGAQQEAHQDSKAGTDLVGQGGVEVIGDRHESPEQSQVAIRALQAVADPQVAALA
jgi:hypothetical protein